MKLILGFIITLCGLYLLGKNIMFTTTYLYYFWQDATATTAVILLAAGTGFLIFLEDNMEKLGWLLIFLSIVCIFMNARIFIKSTSLITLLTGFTCMFTGFRLMYSCRE